MTATLFTFVAVDGSLIEINSDRIDVITPTTFTLPQGVFQGSLITVNGTPHAVQNSMSNLNLVIPSTVVPTSVPSSIIPTFPTVLGSSQTDPFRLIERRYYELWTQHNTPDGMPGTFFLSKVTFYPPWVDPSSKGQQGWAYKVIDLPPYGPQPIDQFYSQSFNRLLDPGFDQLLPQRNVYSTALPAGYGSLMDTNNYNNIALGIP